MLSFDVLARAYKNIALNLLNFQSKLSFANISTNPHRKVR